MTRAQLTSSGDGRFAVSGELGFATVNDLLRQGRMVFQAASALEMDFSAVTHSDSAGLALLIEWRRLARRAGTRLRYRQLPEQLRSLAAISDLEEILTNAG